MATTPPNNPNPNPNAAQQAAAQAAQAAAAAQQAAAQAAAAQANSINQTRQNLINLLQLQRDFADEAQRAAKAVFNSNIQASATAKAFRDIASATRNVEQNFGDVLSGQRTLVQTQKDILQAQKARNALLTEARQALNQIGFTEAQITNALQTQNGIENLILSATQNISNEQYDLADLYQQQLNSLSNQAQELTEIERRARNIDEAFGLAGGSAEVLKTVLGKIGGSGFTQRLGIDEAIENTKEFAADITDGGNRASTLGDKFKIAGNLAKNLGQNLAKSLGPTALLIMAVERLIDAIKLVDSTSGDIAKELGISYDSAKNLVGEMNKAAISSNDIMVNTENLVKAQSTLNNMFGTSVQFSGKMASDFVSIQERLKLSETAMAVFTKLSYLNGKGLKDNLSSVNSIVLKLNQQNKTAFSFKEIQETIGKTSSVIRLNLSSNPKALAAAAIEAKKLGKEISDIEKTSDALLNFESSITSELEAELLTGRELNLERARYAALTGDTVTLGKELNRLVKEAGPDFEKNVVAQKKVAEALGLSREELAEMIENQKSLDAIRALGFDNLNQAQEEYNKMVAVGASQSELDAKFKDKALQSQLESVSQQERFEAVSKRLQETFIALGEALMPIFEVVMDLFENAIKPMIQAISPILKALGQIIGPLIKELVIGLSDALSPIIKIFTDIGDIISDISGGTIEFANIWKGIGKFLGGLISVVFVPLKAFINLITQNVQSMVDILGGFVDIFQGKFSEGFHKIIEGVLGFMLKPFQFLVDIVAGTLNAVIKGINAIPGVDIPLIELDLASSISGVIPFAEGGIVTGPTNALIGEAGPEAVIPLNKLPSMGLLDKLTQEGSPYSITGNGSDPSVNVGATQQSKLVDIEPLIKKLDQLITAVEQGKNVYLDSTKVGTAFSLNT